MNRYWKSFFARIDWRMVKYWASVMRPEADERRRETVLGLRCSK